MLSVPDPQASVDTYRGALASRISSASQKLEAAARHLLEAQGKNVRPLCLKLVGAACHPDGLTLDAHGELAEAIELVHVGSLIHDDILDEADTRRGVAAVHVPWGAKVAVLAGDFLLAQASRKVAGLKEPYLTLRLSEMITDLCEGELLQDEQRGQCDVTIGAYLERIAKKTASPFELAAEGGALLSGAPKRQVAAARRFGFHIGRLFQLVDDSLDWYGDEATLKKPVGQDFEAGFVTLPLLVALEHPVDGSRLLDALRQDFGRARTLANQLVQRHDNRQRTFGLLDEEAERAKVWLNELPACDARDELGTLLTEMMRRVARYQ